jgi:hypothetical protein
MSGTPVGNLLDFHMPAENLLDTPVEAPAENLLDTPAEAPAQNLLDTPAEAPAQNLLDTPAEAPAQNLLDTPAELETPQQKFERLEAESALQPADGSRVSSVDGPADLLADIANDIAKEEKLLGELRTELDGAGSMEARLPPLPKGDESPSKKDIQRQVAINVGKDLGYDIVGAQQRVPKPIHTIAPNLWKDRVKGGTPDPKAAPPKPKTKIGLSALGLKSAKMNLNFSEFASVCLFAYVYCFECSSEVLTFLSLFLLAVSAR